MKRIAQPQSLAEIAAAQLRTAIVTGELRLGESISEEKLAVQMGISRTPVRDCLAILSKEGLVVVRSKRGSFVFETNVKDIGEICDYRLMLELQGIKAAVGRDRSTYLSAMAAILKRMEAAMLGADSVAYGQADTAFHQLAFDLCGNSYLCNAYSLVSGRIAALRANITAPYDARRRESFVEHGTMAGMIENGRYQDLEAALSLHVGRTRDVYIRALREGHLGPSTADVDVSALSYP
ncbi:MAG: GntR family transcriptional regulator [Alphaproteobacteria bacterium]|jgi:DNA-binding GntR family transcriptional regulator|nr:GntR family transcriptional regulator [Alphaproteobacteria bacterium]MBU1551377.1 GntR family transcriptional regulator [Alphaproteobacteria bacterium]MBU2336524.1 GntR family transcriptional regulator [Alphaproteobacteria bacterium]MBU2387938.1 GntR family transcriptional regulator [Alphaproteobacteria bacterium]